MVFPKKLRTFSNLQALMNAGIDQKGESLMILPD